MQNGLTFILVMCSEHWHPSPLSLRWVWYVVQASPWCKTILSQLSECAILRVGLYFLSLSYIYVWNVSLLTKKNWLGEQRVEWLEQISLSAFWKEVFYSPGWLQTCLCAWAVSYSLVHADCGRARAGESWVSHADWSAEVGILHSFHSKRVP